MSVMAVVVVEEVEVEVGVGGVVVVMVVKDGGLQPLGFPAETALWQLVSGCQSWVERTSTYLARKRVVIQGSSILKICFGGLCITEFAQED